MLKNRLAVLVAITMVLALASLSVSAASKTVTIKIEGMHCGGCTSSVTKALKATDGVEDVQVSLEKGEATVKFDDQKVTVAKLHEVITDTGFKVVAEKNSTSGSE
jgi:copper chaperone